MTRGVTLSRGMIALVDDEDFPIVSQFRWLAHWTGGRWYARHERRMGNGQRLRLYMHRFLVEGVEIDHADGNGLNNLRSNLRPADRSTNAANAGQRSDSSQPYKGISMRPSGRWRAQLQGKCLGTYDTPALAARVYDAAALAEFGEFARINFPEGR